jgi:hypothetical protein
MEQIYADIYADWNPGSKRRDLTCGTTHRISTNAQSARSKACRVVGRSKLAKFRVCDGDVRDSVNDLQRTTCGCFTSLKYPPRTYLPTAATAASSAVTDAIRKRSRDTTFTARGCEEQMVITSWRTCNSSVCVLSKIQQLFKNAKSVFGYRTLE